MPSLLSHLPERERQELLADLNYLNTTELKSFCRQHAIPFAVAIETQEGKRKKTRDDDRKGVMLQRVRHFLKTGVVLPETCFPASVVCFEPPPAKPVDSDRLFYGQYDKSNRAVLTLLRHLTAGRFKDGAIARIVAREFWSRGEAPTFQEYAAAWLQAEREHTEPNTEWAFLTDRANKTAPADWKQYRAKKASRVLKVLRQIAPAAKSRGKG